MSFSLTEREDFISFQSPILFPAGENRSCHRVFIVDDDTVERKEEQFVVSLTEFMTTSLHPVVGREAMVAITILDDDSMMLCSLL